MQIQKHIDENDKARKYNEALGAVETAVEDISKKTQNNVDNLSNQLQKEIQQERVERQEEAQEMRQMCESIQKDMRQSQAALDKSVDHIHRQLGDQASSIASLQKVTDGFQEV